MNLNLTISQKFCEIVRLRYTDIRSFPTFFSFLEIRKFCSVNWFREIFLFEQWWPKNKFNCFYVLTFTKLEIIFSNIRKCHQKPDRWMWYIYFWMLIAHHSFSIGYILYIVYLVLFSRSVYKYVDLNSTNFYVFYCRENTENKIWNIFIWTSISFCDDLVALLQWEMW